MPRLTDRMLLRLRRDTRRAVRFDEIYYLEAVGGETLVRIRGSRRLRDVRPLGELLGRLRGRSFLRVHRNHAVNLTHVLEVRRRRGSRGWELRLAPPVNKVLPVSESALDALWKAFGEGEG